MNAITWGFDRELANTLPSCILLSSEKLINYIFWKVGDKMVIYYTLVRPTTTKTTQLSFNVNTNCLLEASKLYGSDI